MQFKAINATTELLTLATLATFSLPSILSNPNYRLGNLTAIAQSNFNNIGANIKIGGNASFNIGGDFNLLTEILESKTTTHDSSHSWTGSSKETTTVDYYLNNIASNLNMGGDLQITTGNDINIMGSDIDTEGDIDMYAANNINLLLSKDTKMHSEKVEKENTVWFSNANTGSIDETSHYNNINSGNSNINITAGNTINAGKISEKNNNTTINNSTIKISSSISLDSIINNDKNSNINSTNNLDNLPDYFKNLHAANINYNPIEEVHKTWNDKTSGLTEVGTAIVAIAAVALTGGGALSAAGAAATAAGGGIMGAAAAGATIGAISSVSVISAVNMVNSKGDLIKATQKTYTKDNLENVLVSATTGAISAGISEYISPASNLSSTTSASNATSNTTTSSSTILTQTTKALTNQTINSISSSIAQSTIKGDSLTDSITNQTKNILINTIGQVGANNIGYLAHTDQINTSTQLLLHGVLGCGMGAAQSGNCIAGGVGAVIGEGSAQALYSSGIDLNTSASIGKAIGTVSSLATVILTGSDPNSKGAASAVYAANMTADNAVDNNLTMIIDGTELTPGKTSGTKKMNPEFLSAVSNTYDELITNFDWNGDNSDSARKDAAQQLTNFIDNYQFAEGEPLNLVGYSHGGNIIKEFTQMYTGDYPIDSLVFLGTPHRDDYQLNWNEVSLNATVVNLYDVQDKVQSYWGGLDKNGSYHQPSQMFNGSNGIGVDNIRVDQQIPWYKSNHRALPSAQNWNQYAAPSINN